MFSLLLAQQGCGLYRYSTVLLIDCLTTVTLFIIKAAQHNQVLYLEWFIHLNNDSKSSLCHCNVPEWQSLFLYCVMV